MLSIGLMSGTSMDGIDAALLETDGKSQITEIADISISYDIEFTTLLKTAEFAVRKADGDLVIARGNFAKTTAEYLQKEFVLADADSNQQVKKLARYFHGNENIPVTFDDIIQRSTELHAAIVERLLQKSNQQAANIKVIGYHGQTLFHRPAAKISLQAGDGKMLAEKTGITVVNDFRSKDVAAGGQGAPFAPLYHQALSVRDNKIPAAVVNCGGIANITVINGADPIDMLGFDTGPGNGLLDRFVKQRTQGAERMDLNGKYGSRGKVHADILKLLYEKSILLNGKNFFALTPPKSLDIGDMNLIPDLDDLSIEDGCATLAAFTADSIANSIEFFSEHIPEYWILAGGGWKNPVILAELKTRLQKRINTNVTIVIAESAGWNSTALEAQIFAYLAVRSLQGLPISFPGTTRVNAPLTGGCVHEA
jgi:anhydro-N-acetylmuramic acid kinase